MSGKPERGGRLKRKGGLKMGERLKRGGRPRIVGRLERNLSWRRVRV